MPVTPDRIKRIRARLELTQPAFAELLGVSVASVRDWEQGRGAPGGPAKKLIELAAMEDQKMDGMFSLRSIERSAKRLPEGAVRQQLLQDVAALRDAMGVHRKLGALIREKTKSKK